MTQELYLWIAAGLILGMVLLDVGDWLWSRLKIWYPRWEHRRAVKSTQSRMGGFLIFEDGDEGVRPIASGEYDEDTENAVTFKFDPDGIITFED